MNSKLAIITLFLLQIAGISFLFFGSSKSQLPPSIEQTLGTLTPSHNLRIPKKDEINQPFSTPVPPLQNGPIPLQGIYEVRSVDKVDLTHINVFVQYTGPETTYSMDKNRLVVNLLVQIVISGEDELGIKLVDQQTPLFEVPYSEIFPHDKIFSFPLTNSFQIEITQPEFGLIITRRQTGEVVFDTSNMFFVYSELYHQISIKMKDEHIYGLGERRRSFLYSSGQYTFLNKDQYMSMSTGWPNQQTYGTHPMYLRRESSGKYHVLFLRNFNSIQAQYNSGDSLTFIVVGGLIEFKLFLGNEYPETALKPYHAYVNGFALHPFWSHGFHQCRWGYDNSDKMIQVWEKFNELDLPFDTIWSDIDYMNKLTDFTVDTTRYNATDMNVMLDRDNSEGVHWVPIIDAGIAFGDVSNERGKELGVYQKSNKTNEDLIGCVWPGKVNFVDFNHPNSYDFWAEGLMNITKNYNITPSGFWTDMNEFSNFVNGEISDSEVCIMPNDPNAPVNEDYLGIRVEDYYTNIPFQVGGQDHPMQEKTMSYDAPKYNEPDAKTFYSANGDLREFDFHNLNGFSEGIATNQALKKMGNQLPFIISRSQIAGSGQFVQHWTGDNGSNWDFLQTSLSEIFNFNLYGMPMTGVDICGFAMNTTAELCARWMQVGSLYPFSRNHNANDTIAQEPYAFTEDYVLNSSRSSLKLRYALLKQYYAYFVLSNGVGTIFRPLFFNFPYDTSLLSQDQSFMISDSLLAIPVLIPSADASLGYTEIHAYFPQDSAFYEFNKVNGRRYTHADSNTPLQVPLDSTTPLFLREGSVVFTQFRNNARRARLLDNHFEIHIALQKYGALYVASGQFLTLNDYSDDNLINKCQGVNNCSFNIDVECFSESNLFTLIFTFTGLTSDTFFDELFIDQATIYAEDLTFANEPIVFEPIDIKGNTSVKLTFKYDGSQISQSPTLHYQESSEY